MSYILDALRKADSQRERDASRGIHAQSVSLGIDRGPDAAAPRVFMWGAIAAGVVVIAAAIWYFTREPERVVPAAVPQPTVATPLAMQPPVVPPPTQGSNPVAANAISPPPPPPVPMPMRTPPTFQPPAVAATPTPIATPAAPVTTGLPPDAPKVSISGGVYSPNPAQRMLIVNGQVFNEGSEVAPGLVVDKIEARTAVLRFRGARYTVAY